MFSQGVVPKGRMFRRRTGDRIHQNPWFPLNFGQMFCGISLAQVPWAKRWWVAVRYLLCFTSVVRCPDDPRRVNLMISKELMKFECFEFQLSNVSFFDFEAWPTWRETWASSPCCLSPKPFITRGAVFDLCRLPQLSKIQWFLLQLHGATVVYKLHPAEQRL